MSEYRYTEHEGRPGIWAQGEGVFFPDVPPEVSVHALYREGLRLAEIAVETGPGIDGLAARALRKEVLRLRAALSGLLGGMDEICHVQHGTTWRGGQHTEAMYQEAVAALLNLTFSVAQGDRP